VKCFISYTQADLSWAEWIAWQLEESGLQTILQAWDFRAGCNFVLEMDSASKQAQRTIAVLSDSYVNAAYTHPEWASALARDPTGAKRALLPIRVHECTLSGLLAQVVYIDLVGLTEIGAKSRLLSQLQGERGKPSAAPRFPGRSSDPAANKAPPYPASDASAHTSGTHAPSFFGPLIVESETEVVRKAEEDLIPYVGPVAKALIRRAIAKAGTTADLYAELAAAIPSESERQNFLRRATDRPGTGTSWPPAPGGGSQPQSGIFSASVLEQLRYDLTGHLGPIAKLAIDQESGSATSLEDLYRRLGEHLPAGAERLAFLNRLPAAC
jgi:TIR domain